MSNSAADPTPSVPSPEMRRLIDEYTETVQRQMHLGSGVWTDEKRRVAEAALLSSIARLQNVVEAAAKVDMLESMVMVPDEESAQAFREMHEAIDAARTTDSPR
jgi:hypothetical protein